ncbi:MAG: cation:proton antiporter, partial [Gammaproteobacteria bacterium]|nr:cation:proton antiporter [Gammaproteobacteria bacterium]
IFLGGLGGWLTGKAFLRGYVPEFLKSPVMLTLVLVVFELSNALQHEAGLLAVTIMGMVIGNMHIPGLQDMRRFKEYITVMLVSAVFILLTADIDLRIARVIGWRGVALIAAVLFICRPLTIWLATIKSGMPRNDRILLAWIAPRGIVAAATAGVMGPRLYEAGYPGADALLPLIFFVIFVTVVLHGMSIGWLSRRLGLAAPDKQSLLIVGGSPWAIAFANKLKSLNVGVLVADNSWHNLRAARLAGVPVFYGEILSDFAEATVEISHIDAVFAATSNDAYNALVCNALAPEIGRKAVYQLPMGVGSDEGDRGVARSIRGKPAFQADAVFERLWKLHIRGWQFYSTKLSENYTYSDFLGDASADAMLLVVIKANDDLVLESENEKLEPVAGDTLLYYAPDKTSEKTTDKLSDTGRLDLKNMDFTSGI